MDAKKNAPFGARGVSAGTENHTATPPIDLVLDRLDKVTQAKGGWTARCPAHDDRGPSLSIAEGTDGRVLLHCFAGCPASAVVDSIGLQMSDLFPRDESPRGRGQRRQHVGIRQRLEVEQALRLEMLVLSQCQTGRANALVHRLDHSRVNPDKRLAMLEPWAREAQAAARIARALEVLYGR